MIGGRSEDGLRDRVGDRLRDLSSREALGLVALAAVLVAGLVVWYVRSLPARVEVVADAVPRTTTRASPSPPPAALLVHVAGAVRRPGVYELREGDRVIDAIRRAGGARGGADLGAINLAALLADAQQILVPRRGGDGTSAGGPTTSAGVAEALVNVNTATVEELETLPGIGEVLAQRIVEHREQHGPFRSIEDLLDVSGIGEKRFEDLRDRVTV